MAHRLVAGVDCSTQATKVLLVDAATGAVVATGRAPHEVHGSDGARETHPRVWEHALRDALASTGRAGDVAAIAIGGQQHGLVVRDRAGEPLRPALLWNDVRSAPDAAALVEALGADAWAERTGSVPVASYTVSKWAWLRRTEPATAAATASVRLPHDHLTELLCGEAVTDRGDTSGTCWWSPATGAYDDAILGLQAVRLDPALLPRVLGPREAAGPVTSLAEKAFGLPKGAVVAPGTGDNMAAALGLGLGPGTPVLSLGTSGVVSAVSQRRIADPTGIVAGFADATGRFLPLACTLNCTLAVDRIAAWLHLGRDAVTPSTEVVVLPYLDGERTPNLPDASGTIVGLRHDTEPGAILRAAYEGAVASLLQALDLVAQHSGGLPDDAPLVLIGGGAKGAAWRDVAGALSGRALQVPDAEELVAIGAAVQAAAVLDGEDPVAVARRWNTRAGTTLDPRPRDDAALARIAKLQEMLLH